MFTQFATAEVAYIISLTKLSLSSLLVVSGGCVCFCMSVYVWL